LPILAEPRRTLLALFECAHRVGHALRRFLLRQLLVQAGLEHVYADPPHFAGDIVVIDVVDADGHGSLRRTATHKRHYWESRANSARPLLRSETSLDGLPGVPTPFSTLKHLPVS